MKAHGKVFKYGDNVDTDVIIPARYLNSSDPAELATHCMEDIDKEFVNKVHKGDIIVAEKNFGCGSSREHAAWALTQYGFRVVIAPSFADIFYNNAFKNGLLPISLPEFVVDYLFDEIKAHNGYQLSVDLVNRVVIEPNGKRHEFEVPEFRRYCLLNGLDDIGITLQHADEIKAFEQQRLNQKPWLAKTIY